MYSQLIYLIIALLLFTVQQPGSVAFRPAAETSILALGMFLLYVLICRILFQRILRRAEWSFSTSSVAIGYHRLQAHLSILALIFIAFYVYVLNIKFYLSGLPGFESSITLPGLVGIVIYLIHLSVVWYWSYPVYKWIHRSSMTRRAYLRGNAGFLMAILVPWLLISLASDLFSLVKTPSFLGSELGDVILMGVVLAVFLLFAPWLVVRLWGSEPIPRTPLREEMERFCRIHHFKVGELMLWPLFGGEMLTAAVMGILPRLRYILVTRGLLSLLSVDELKAVIAHEMGHVRRYHLPFYLLFFVAYSVLAYSMEDLLLLFLMRWSSVLHWSSSSSESSLTLFSVIYTLPALILMVIYFRYVFGFFMRNSERQADLYALQLIGHPFTLISSLQKIAFHSGHIEDLPSWHHFSIRQRIQFLLDSHQNPSLIKRHNRKLYGSALLLFALIAGVTAVGTQLKHTQVVQSWQKDVQLRMLEEQLKGTDGNADLYAAYGGMLFERGRYQEAEAILKKALELAPGNTSVMNNLAWLYATSPPPLFQPKAALQLALEAQSGEPQSPHVLDTLAEAYFVNGDFREAVASIDRALANHPHNKSYYLEQKKKFEEAQKHAEGE